ncbi:MAG: Lrp/AsnC family transcriptional regulator [Abditibacteriota bacterium]|nr:Lrp/AsnC family transcriptional regulator [Abditibacteriota bacterium]
MDIRDKIIKILHEDARTTDAQIAIMLDIEEDEARKIRKELENSDIIKKYSVVIDSEKLDEQPVFAFIDCKVTPTKGVGYDDIAKKIYKFPEVHSLFLVSGVCDLRVVVKGKTMQDVAFFVAEKLAREEGILSVQSSFLLRTYKSDGNLIFEEPKDERLQVSP